MFMKNEEKILSFFSKVECKLERGLLCQINVLKLGYKDVDLDEEYANGLDKFCVSDLFCSGFGGCLPVIENKDNVYRLMWVYVYVYRFDKSFLLTTDDEKGVRTNLKLAFYNSEMKEYLKNNDTENLIVF